MQKKSEEGYYPCIGVVIPYTFDLFLVIISTTADLVPKPDSLTYSVSYLIRQPLLKLDCKVFRHTLTLKQVKYADAPAVDDS